MISRFVNLQRRNIGVTTTRAFRTASTARPNTAVPVR
jgi:hypothetical protein